ncbi:aspartyl-phosphate phosphatase Spo0E family protein [Paenibacillus sp. 1011MAR3C5]|uniref:aspartyl-phosphate phosphatase Spo0E family protein n=1 Tax=Paenibacillus sp. 1011MAR3C5 TaxID=1675787 RepID=UPI000E6D229D|nr:aspartyl-phosphate phosphatase Spo0E family protein [Paenibacillus sp. 1011MAR3C5]RJE88712.1 aspartyl-phosphate phosphatase Spo0E family protein [Paenibacillus sp. 1011MAR3C5]
MLYLHERIEQERRKMNTLGEALIEQVIPLSEHEELLAISRKVDKLMLRLHLKKLQNSGRLYRRGGTSLEASDMV